MCNTWPSVGYCFTKADINTGDFHWYTIFWQCKSHYNLYDNATVQCAVILCIAPWKKLFVLSWETHNTCLRDRSTWLCGITYTFTSDTPHVKLLLKVKWQSHNETTRRTSNLEINNQRKSTKALLVWVQFPYLQFLNFLSHYLLSVEILSEQERAKRLMWAGGRQ